jgi:hypothetical protein
MMTEVSTSTIIVKIIVLLLRASMRCMHWLLFVVLSTPTSGVHPNFYTRCIEDQGYVNWETHIFSATCVGLSITKNWIIWHGGFLFLRDFARWGTPGTRLHYAVRRVGSWSQSLQKTYPACSGILSVLVWYSSRGFEETARVDSDICTSESSLCRDLDVYII